MPVKWTRPSAVAKAMADKKKAQKAPKADKPKGKKPADAKAMAGKEAK